MLTRIALLATLTLTTALTTACSGQMPLRPAAQLQAASLRNTNGALMLIEEMAHATQPQEFERIEAAFRVEISKSSRPSLQKIIKQSSDAINHHPMPDGNSMDHPVVRLIHVSLERYIDLNNRTLVPRLMGMLKIIDTPPAQQEALIQKLQIQLHSTPKMDLRQMIKLISEGVFAELLPMDSPLHARFIAMLQAQLAG